MSKLAILFLAFPLAALAQDPADAICPRPQPGAIVQPPAELRSANGLLEATILLRTAFDQHHLQRFCYLVNGVEAPTLRVRPGDTLLIHFQNDISTDIHPQTAFPNADHPSGEAHIHTAGLPSPTNPADAPCFATSMSARGSNLHFHGLAISPICHQDEVVRTMVRSGQAFDYRIPIPADEPPGLYWYHPHPHGYSESQVLGGASGAIIVDAPEKSQLAERTLILRDQLVTEATAKRHATDTALPTWDVSLNFVPVLYPDYRPARLQLPSSTRELWRILNASADQILDLEYVISGKSQTFLITGVDGTPLSRAEQGTHLSLPPGARVEVQVMTPPPNSTAELRTRAVDTGPDGETIPARRIATLETTHAGTATGVESPAAVASQRTSANAAPSPPAYQRHLFFSEHSDDPKNKEARTQFFLTLEGREPKPYEMGQPADITVHRGAVEEWTIENRARELHIFHIHQLHFTVLAINGQPTHDETLRDTFEVPYWRGTGPYPSIRVRLDFRSRNIVGSFVYHCHILGHEDAGMMGGIDVLPEGFASRLMLKKEGGRLVATLFPTAANIAPSGTVQFQRGGRVIAEVPLLPDASIPAQDGVTAIYSGDVFFSASAASH